MAPTGMPSPLANPVRDAEAMAAQLTKLGFDVVKGLDLDLRSIGDVQGAFEDKLLGKPDVALLFYAGHGLQVEGRNYLVPVDAEITTKSHLATRALLFNDLLDDMARDAGASLIFLDACRDNPFTRNLARSLGDSARYAGVRGGLARIEKVAGTFIAYATAPDKVAFDGKGENSPFTSALLQHIETPGLSVGDLMIDVRNKVLAETNNRQEPWDQSSLRARFYFVPPEPENMAAPAAPPSEAEREWVAIQGTTSLAVLAAFQERHPDPPWLDYAEARANELRAADAARVAAEEAERQRADKLRQSEVAATKREPSPASPPGLSWPKLAGAAAVLTLVGALAFWQPWLPADPDGPVSIETEAAGAKADDDSFAVAERRGALDGYGEYLGRFPDGRHAVTARERIAYLRKLEADFARLSATGTKKALNEFAGANPAFKSRVDAVLETRMATEAEEPRRAAAEAERQRVAALEAQLEREAEDARRRQEAEVTRKTEAPSCAGIITEVAGKWGMACLDPTDPAKREFEDCRDGICGPVMVALQPELKNGRLGNCEINSPFVTVKFLCDDASMQPRPHKSAFGISKFAVMGSEWSSCISDGKCKARGRRSKSRPELANVSWIQINNEFLPWLNAKLGLSGAASYRLPSAAEWKFGWLTGELKTERGSFFGYSEWCDKLF